MITILAVTVMLLLHLLISEVQAAHDEAEQSMPTLRCPAGFIWNSSFNACTWTAVDLNRLAIPTNNLCEHFQSRIIETADTITCTSDPVPMMQVYDRIVQTEHPYSSNTKQSWSVAFPETHCYDVWYHHASSTCNRHHSVKITAKHYGRRQTSRIIRPTMYGDKFSSGVGSSRENAIRIDADEIRFDFDAAKGADTDFGFIAYVAPCSRR